MIILPMPTEEELKGIYELVSKITNTEPSEFKEGPYHENIMGSFYELLDSYNDKEETK